MADHSQGNFPPGSRQSSLPKVLSGENSRYPRLNVLGSELVDVLYQRVSEDTECFRVRRRRCSLAIEITGAKIVALGEGALRNGNLDSSLCLYGELPRTF